MVPAVLVTTADDAVKAAADFGGPLALKVASADILHKSDIGGVRLGVAAGESAVRDAYQAVMAAAAAVSGAHVEGVLISPMRTGGTELLVGVVRDAQWGPILAVAFGGVFVEVLRDSVLMPLPVTPARVRARLERLRGIALLTGARGSRQPAWTRWPRWWPGWGTSRWRSATTWSHWRSTRCALTAPPSRPWMPR